MHVVVEVEVRGVGWGWHQTSGQTRKRVKVLTTCTLTSWSSDWRSWVFVWNRPNKALPSVSDEWRKTSWRYLNLFSISTHTSAWWLKGGTVLRKETWIFYWPREEKYGDKVEILSEKILSRILVDKREAKKAIWYMMCIYSWRETLRKKKKKLLTLSEKALSLELIPTTGMW